MVAPDPAPIRPSAPFSANRRDVLAGAALFALAIGLPTLAAHQIALPADETPTPTEEAVLRRVCDIVVPATDTPGALAVGVPAFVALALAHGLEGSRAPMADAPAGAPLRADGSLRHLTWLVQALMQAGGGAFLTLPPARQVALVTALDAAAFPPGPPPANPSPWVTLKALILDGYYGSEVGASQELQYNLVPGRWDPDIPLEPGARAYSSDWTAVDFG